MKVKNPLMPANDSSAQQLPMLDLRVFEAMPCNSILVAVDKPEYTILAVTDSMCKRAGLSRADMINKPFFTPFPLNPSNPDDPNSAGQDIVAASFEQVIKTRAIHQLPVVRYDLENTPGTFTERYWKVYNKPVLDAAGNVIYILHTSEDISAQVKT